MKILLGNSLAPTLCDYFQLSASQTPGLISLLPASIDKFVATDGFSEIQSTPEDLKGQPVIVIQSPAAVGDHTTNDFAMELLFTVRTLKRNKAGPVWVIMPFAGYSRQDRPFNGRMTSVGADDFAFLLKAAGAVGVSTIEMHSPAGFKFFRKRFGKNNAFNLLPTDLFVADLKTHAAGRDIVVGGPDGGAHARAEAVARALNAPSFSIEKGHIGVNDTEVKSFIGDVRGKASLTIDDMFDTCGTIDNAQATLIGEGAIERFVYGAHPLFNKGGLERLFTSKTASGKPTIQQLVFTDTVDSSAKVAQLKRQYGAKKVDAFMRMLSVGPMLHDHIIRDVISHPSMAAGLRAG